MENNEIMMDNEVMETTTDVVKTAGSSKAFKAAAGIGLGVLIGTAVYNIYKRRKAKKEAAEVECEEACDPEVADQ